MSNHERAKWFALVGLNESSLIIHPGNMYAYDINPITRTAYIATYLLKKSRACTKYKNIDEGIINE